MAYVLIKLAMPSENVFSSMRKMHRFRIVPRMRKVLSGHLFSIDPTILLADSEVPNHCADAQTDLGLHCPHMLEDTFSHGVTQMNN